MLILWQPHGRIKSECPARQHHALLQGAQFAALAGGKHMDGPGAVLAEAGADAAVHCGSMQRDGQVDPVVSGSAAERRTTPEAVTGGNLCIACGNTRCLVNVIACGLPEHQIILT